MAAQSPKKTRPKAASEDVVLVYGRSEDGTQYGVVRKQGDEVRVGTMRELQEGKPIHGEVVRLKPREESAALFDVEVQHDMSPTLGRPPKVTTAQYRKGWDSIWAKKQPDRTLN